MVPMKVHMLTDELEARFDDQGFVILKGVLDEHDVAAQNTALWLPLQLLHATQPHVFFDPAETQNTPRSVSRTG